jgi:hypothetical protein
MISIVPLVKSLTIMFLKKSIFFYDKLSYFYANYIQANLILLPISVLMAL